MASGNRTGILWGKDSGANNALYLGFQYNGNNSTSNQFQLYFQGSGPQINVQPTLTSINTETTINGHLSITSTDASSLRAYNNIGDNYIWIGKNSSTYNKCVFGYRHAGDGSTSNYGLIWLEGDVMKFYYNKVEIVQPLTISKAFGHPAYPLTMLNSTSGTGSGNNPIRTHMTLGYAQTNYNSSVMFFDHYPDNNYNAGYWSLWGANGLYVKKNDCGCDNNFTIAGKLNGCWIGGFRSDNSKFIPTVGTDGGMEIGWSQY